MDPNGFMREAKIQFASGNLSESVRLFSLAEQDGCDEIEIWLSRGAAEMALGHFAEAKDDFSKVLKKDTDNERAYYFRGIAHLALKDYSLAVEDLTDSLSRNNDRGIAHLARGLAYVELGEESDATLDINSASAFSEAELKSFKNLFGEHPGNPFENAREILARENAPWNTLLGEKNGQKLLKIFQ